MTELEILKARLDLMEKEVATLKNEVVHGLRPLYSNPPTLPLTTHSLEWPYQVTC
jgi:hypothetical protein